MSIVVCDANILIDLLQVDLFTAFLKLKCEIHVPADVADEVKEDNSDQLVQAIDTGKILFPDFTPEIPFSEFKITKHNTRLFQSKIAHACFWQKIAMQFCSPVSAN